MVDAAAFIDPVVPVASAKSGGAVVKKGLRTLSLWYMGYVTHQVSQFATAVSRSLHLLDDRVGALQSQLDAQQVPPAPVVEAPGWAHGPDAWWVADALAALAAGTGPGPPRRRRGRVAGAGARRQGGGRLRRRPAARDGRPGRARRDRPARGGRCSSTCGPSNRPPSAGSS